MSQQNPTALEKKWTEEVDPFLIRASRASKKYNIPLKWECIIDGELFYYESNGKEGSEYREIAGRRPV
jgi:hypothetical protein